MSITGIKATVARLNRLGAAAKAEFAKANMENAQDLVDLAKVLVVSDTQRPLIHAETAENGGAIADFGPKAKVIEGERGPRPFVNPALKVSAKRRRQRNRKALKNALAKG